MSKQIHDLRLLQVRVLSPDYRALDFLAPVPLPLVIPGQFAEIAPPGNKVFLRRPFSVYDINYERNTISFLVKIVGPGTRAICDILPGETLNMIYPLGIGFTLPTGPRSLLAGGGVGIAPMLLLGKFLTQNGIEPEFILGGRGKNEIVDVETFRTLGTVHITTDDGSLGHKGLITEHPVFARIGDYDRVYVCGPDPMMHAVARLCATAGTDCEASLENTMACGFGVCLSCVTRTEEGNQTVCTAGPVFNTRRLLSWNLPFDEGIIKPEKEERP